MLYESWEALKIREVEKFITYKRKKILKATDVAFDTEGKQKELISLQFSVGKDKSKVVLWNTNKIRHSKKITAEQLLALVLEFLKEQGIEPEKHIYLVAHFGQAEVTHIQDWHIRQKGDRAPSQFNKAIRWEKTIDDHKLHIIDTFGHLPLGLGNPAVTKAFGYPKKSFEGLGGKTEEYWYNHLKELVDKHPKEFEEYAIRDVELEWKIWTSLLDRYIPLGVDPHIYPTFSSITVASFQRRLKDFHVCKVRRIPKKGGKWVTDKKTKKREWRKYETTRLVYNADPLIRKFACLCYWGGNNQAFVAGYQKGVYATHWDFVSLYIIAGILQPLPNSLTKWIRFKDLETALQLEGFCRVQFKFPDSCNYPCLPTQTENFQKLVFPSEGESLCTLRELKVALDLKVEIIEIEGIGFKPTPNETDHIFKPFLLEMLQKKTALDKSGKKGSAERLHEKLKMVGVVGRLAYRKSSYSVSDLLDFMDDTGINFERFRIIGRKKRARAEYTKHKGEVGNTWCIEWASLILGNARSYIAQLIATPTCILVSTDGGLWLGDPKFHELPMHKLMQKFYSGIRKEEEADEVWLQKNRFYSYWNKGEYVHAAAGGIDSTGKIKKDRRPFAELIRKGLELKKPPQEFLETIRLSNLNDFYFDGVPLNSEVPQKKRISWKWDFKRKIVKYSPEYLRDHPEVFWTEALLTRPYRTIHEAYVDQCLFDGTRIQRRKGFQETIPKKIKKFIRKFKGTDRQCQRAVKKKYEYFVSLSSVNRTRRGLQF